MGFIQEFKEFAVKGNVIDLAVGVVIGAAFGKIVDSLVKDIVMPPIGYIIKGINFEDLKWTVGEAEIKYGMFLQNCLHFFIIALVIFIVVKQFNRLKRREAEQPPTTKKCPYCTETISVEARKCSHCTADLVSA